MRINLAEIIKIPFYDESPQTQLPMYLFLQDSVIDCRDFK